MGAKFCQECGTKLAEGAKFCPECGAKINQAEAKPEPLFDFSDDTAKYGGADFGGFDGMLKNQQQAQVNSKAEEEEALKLATELYNAKKYDKAVPVFKKYAEKGNAEAQFRLGYCYIYGKGVLKDEKEAVNWYTKAGEQGHIEAQGYLGEFYINEIEEIYSRCGGSLDKGGASYEDAKKKAVYWLKKAAEQGDETSKEYLEDFGDILGIK